jgi:hypothetical protein
MAPSSNSRITIISYRWILIVLSGNRVGKRERKMPESKVKIISCNFG